MGPKDYPPPKHKRICSPNVLKERIQKDTQLPVLSLDPYPKDQQAGLKLLNL